MYVNVVMFMLKILFLDFHFYFKDSACFALDNNLQVIL